MSEGQIIQKLLFDEKDVFAEGKKDKTYRAIRHDVVRLKQDVNCNTVHHPVKKILQIRKVLSGFNNGKKLKQRTILVFAIGRYLGHQLCNKIRQLVLRDVTLTA
jgi:hypothetical protein